MYLLHAAQGSINCVHKHAIARLEYQVESLKPTPDPHSTACHILSAPEKFGTSVLMLLA